VCAYNYIRGIDFSNTKASQEQLQDLQEILEVALKQEKNLLSFTVV
jgi:hypothetical protein